ncbi:MAG: phosphatase PAP2 family protein [Elusimicrobiales bacterium]
MASHLRHKKAFTLKSQLVARTEAVAGADSPTQNLTSIPAGYVRKILHRNVPPAAGEFRNPTAISGFTGLRACPHFFVPNLLRPFSSRFSQPTAISGLSGRLRLLPAALILAAAQCAGICAGGPRDGAAAAYYVPAERFTQAAFPPPPSVDSEEQRADDAVLEQWRKKRTDADCLRANRTFYITFAHLWGENSPFPQPLPPEVRDFFSRVDSDIGTAARMMKNRYRRPRPDNQNPCPDPRAADGRPGGGGYSYPSTHAAISRVFAEALADLVPKRRDEFIAAADGIAFDRVVIGVHYPSDISAGKKFGVMFHDEMLKSEAYRRDMAQAKIFLLSPR